MTETVKVHYETEDPFTGKVRCYPTLEAASADSIKRNKKDANHPAYRLYKVYDDDDRCFKGRLWRAFGCDFDPKDCWRGDAP